MSIFAANQTDHFGSTGGLYISSEVIVYIRKFLVCPLGVGCNVLALIIFYRRPLKQCHITAYLVAMAFTDSVYLMSDTINEIIKIAKATSTLYCKIAHYLAMVSSTCSDALVASVAVHRSVAVSCPHKVKVIMTTKNALIAVGICFFLANGMYIHTFWLYIYDQDTGWCQHMHDIVQRVDALILLLRSLVILLVIMVSSFVIMVRLRQQRLLRDTMTAGLHNRSEQRDAQIGTLLLSISLLYLITNVPLAIFLLVESIYPWDDIDSFHYDLHHLLYVILYTLKNLNHALNFFIHCRAAAGFKEEVKEIRCRYKCKCKCHCNGGWNPSRRKIYAVQA